MAADSQRYMFLGRLARLGDSLVAARILADVTWIDTVGSAPALDWLRQTARVWLTRLGANGSPEIREQVAAWFAEHDGAVPAGLLPPPGDSRESNRSSRARK